MLMPWEFSLLLEIGAVAFPGLTRYAPAVGNDPPTKATQDQKQTDTA
jgi:hypothetical protein